MLAQLYTYMIGLFLHIFYICISVRIYVRTHVYTLQNTKLRIKHIYIYIEKRKKKKEKLNLHTLNREGAINMLVMTKKDN